MNTKKMIRVIKNTLSWFVVGSGLTGVVMGVVTAFIVTLPGGAIALASISLGLLVGILAGGHAAHEYEIEIAENEKHQKRRVEQRIILEKLEKQLNDLKCLEKKCFEPDSIEIEIPTDEIPDAHRWRGFSGKGVKLLFSYPVNDQIYAGEAEKYVVNAPPGCIRFTYRDTEAKL